MDVFRPTLSAALLAALLNSALSAQTAAIRAPADSSDVLVLDHDFTAPDEYVRVFLQHGQVYRADISSRDAVLEIRGVVRNEKLPHVYPFLPSQSPSGSTLIEIYPQTDAEYEIRSRVISGSQLPTRLRVYRDVEASRRRQYVRRTPGWEIGVELAGGWHSGYAQSSSVPPAGSTSEAGTDVEACFSARGAALSRLGMCALGLGYQSQHGDRSILWIYTEPRYRILGRVLPGKSHWELGALFRLGLGSISSSSATPVVLGPGIYVARHIRGGSQGAGLSLQAAYTRAWYKGFSRQVGAEPFTPNSNRLSFGIGWYR